MKSSTQRKTYPPGCPHWPEFADIVWPVTLQRPTIDQVCRQAYAMVGLDYKDPEHRVFAKFSRVGYKAPILMAAMPVMIGALSMSSQASTRALGMTRSVRRDEHIVKAMQTPAGKILAGHLLGLLIAEQRQKGGASA